MAFPSGSEPVPEKLTAVPDVTVGLVVGVVIEAVGAELAVHMALLEARQETLEPPHEPEHVQVVELPAAGKAGFEGLAVPVEQKVPEYEVVVYG